MPSLPYNPNVPTPSHNPSSDVGDMLQNGQSVNNIWNVDHYSFSNNNAGTHQQVTFAEVNVPSSPTTPPILFTNTQDGAGTNLPGGLAQLFFYTGAATASKNQYIVGSFGSVLLTAGIILKWGTKFPGSATGTSVNLNFSAMGVNAFPNNCFAAFAIGFNNSRIYSVNALTASGFTVIANTSLGAGDTFYWLAIGN